MAAIDRALKAEEMQPHQNEKVAALLVDGFIFDVPPTNDFRL
jgi:hypothetical protein